MKDTRDGDWITFFLFGTAIGAVAALLAAPASGARTRRTNRRKGEDVADYLVDIVDAGKELADRCEHLYKRSGEFFGETAHELSDKYRQLYQRSKELVDEAAGMIRGGSKSCANG